MSNEAFGLQPGSVIQDTYRIDALLGQGGMGATFKGVNLTTNHEVAIKVMIPSFAANNKAADLFKRESTMLRQVRHDAVINYETTLRDKDGKLFLIMEYVNGKSLADYIKRGARLPAVEVLRLGRRLAGGLRAIHKLGIVHRDVAPDNILIPNDNIGAAKFIDFGLASDTVGTDKSIIGDSFAGKLSYSAPEQLGLFGNKTTHKTDYYALGLVLLRVAGLPVPGEGKGFAALDDRRVDITVAGKGVTPPLKVALEQILKADPADRADDLVGLFETALSTEESRMSAEAPKVGGSSIRGVDSEVGDGGAAPSKSKLPVVIGGAAAAVAIAAGAYFALFSGSGSDDATGSGSEAQAEVAAEVLQQDNPLDRARALLEAGNADSGNSAVAVLTEIGRDESQPRTTRQDAFILLAELFDPNTFEARNSPFSRANANTARRYYQRAADLGSDAARAAIANLPEG